MSTRAVVLLVHFLGYFALFLAAGFAALNVVRATRRARQGAGPSPIPGVVTVLGLLALRALSVTLHRPALWGFGPLLVVILVDVGSWLLPPAAARRRGPADPG